MFAQNRLFRSTLVTLLVLALTLGAFGPALAAVRQPRMSVTITSPSANATLVPGGQISVQTSGSVVRVEYSIVSTNYTGLTENYLGSSTTAPFSFTWNGKASAIISGGGTNRLMARAYNSSNSMVTHEIPVSVPGTFNGTLSPAKNTAASPYYEAALFNGAAWISHSQNSAVRPLVELNAGGEAAEYTLTAAVGGNYEITVAQYKLTGTKPNFEVRVNGAVSQPSLAAVRTVTATNDFGREGQTTFVASLNAGSNLIRVTSLGAGTLNIGSIRIAQP